MAKQKFSKSVLETVKLPPGLLSAITSLMQAAESIFPSGSGAQKKEWVKKAALELASKVDIKAIPDWIERPGKDAIIGFVIEILWGLGAQARK